MILVNRKEFENNLYLMNINHIWILSCSIQQLNTTHHLVDKNRTIRDLIINSKYLKLTKYIKLNEII